MSDPGCRIYDWGTCAFDFVFLIFYLCLSTYICGLYLCVLAPLSEELLWNGKIFRNYYD